MTPRCDMGVGCDEYGVCYATAHGEPQRCPLAAPLTEEQRQRILGQWDAYNEVLNLLNTFEERMVDKSDLYHRVFAMRPAW